MRILVDGTRLRIGGALQAGLSVLENAARTLEHEWFIVLSKSFAESALSLDLSFCRKLWILSNSSGAYSQLAEAYSTLPRIEAAVSPDVAFTIFGPTLWKAKSPHLVGFALAMLCYPEERKRSLAHARLVERLTAPIIDGWAHLRLTRAKYLVVETNTIKELLHSRLKISRERIFVVPNTYSTTFARSLSESNRVLQPDVFQIFVPSAYYPHKNLDIVPLVAKSLADKLARPFRFLLTLDSSSDEWKRIARSAESKGVSDCVASCGSIPHAKIASKYLQCQAVFLPTLLECSTAVFAEAFIAGLPLVTSDRDFARELCGDAAIYVDPYSHHDAAEALATIYRSTEIRNRLIESGKNMLEKTYVSPEQKWNEQLKCLTTIARFGD